MWMYIFWYCAADLPVDCSELYNKGEANSGVYVIKPNRSEPFNVYCEMGSGEWDNSNLKFQRKCIKIQFLCSKALTYLKMKSLASISGQGTRQKVIKLDSHRNRLSRRAHTGVNNLFTLSVIRKLPDPCVNRCVTCASNWNILLIHSADGGSTVIQHRIDGSVDFDQTWEKYEEGFGDLESG